MWKMKVWKIKITKIQRTLRLNKSYFRVDFPTHLTFCFIFNTFFCLIFSINWILICVTLCLFNQLSKWRYQFICDFKLSNLSNPFTRIDMLIMWNVKYWKGHQTYRRLKCKLCNLVQMWTHVSLSVFTVSYNITHTGMLRKCGISKWTVMWIED